MKIFNELGSRVEDLWREKNYAEAAFPDIALLALAEASLVEKVSPWEIVRWVFTESQLPRQLDIDGRFGSPPITLYAGPRFHIDIYFWLDGTTDIHQHSFAGAFQVLMGSSIHSRYTFEEKDAINTNFVLGEVIFESVEILNQGDIRKIIAGRDYIHSLFHLDRPSATITIRTYDVPTAFPQYSYRKPHLAYNPFFKEVSTVKKLQTVELLLHMQHPDADAMIGALVSQADFQTTFLILQMVFQVLNFDELQKVLQLSTGQDRFDHLLERARRRHGSLVDSILPVLREEQRLTDIVNRRKFITSNEHRFFLALLLNVSSRPMIFELVKQVFPDRNPMDTVLDWVMDLSTTRVWGSSEPNVLGIKDFDHDYLFVLECLLRDYSGEQIKASLEREYPADYARKLEGEVEAIANTLRNSLLFKATLAH